MQSSAIFKIKNDNLQRIKFTTLQYLSPVLFASLVAKKINYNLHSFTTPSQIITSQNVRHSLYTLYKVHYIQIVNNQNQKQRK